MEQMQDFLNYILSGCIAIITFFLRSFYSKSEANVEKLTKLESDVRLLNQEIESLENKAYSKIDNLTSLTNLRFEQLAKAIDDLTHNIAHLNSNVKHKDNATSELLTEILKKLNI